MIENYPPHVRVEPKHRDDIARAAKVLSGESDRGAAIIGAVILDLALTAALKEHLQKHEKVAETFFAVTGPVGDFATKIDLALLAGLVGKHLYRDLVDRI